MAKGRKTGGTVPTPPLVRLLGMTSPEPNTGCWLWLGSVNHKGYGLFRCDGKVQSAHRVSYNLLVGEIPDGMQIDHLCRVRCCVNPQHLEPVTPLENTRRGKSGDYNRNKTHCPHGHEYSGKNLRLRKTGRACAACQAAIQQKRRERKGATV